MTTTEKNLCFTHFIIQNIKKHITRGQTWVVFEIQVFVIRIWYLILGTFSEVSCI